MLQSVFEKKSQTRFLVCQHIFNKNAIAFCAVLHKHMGDGTDKPAILYDGGATHSLNNAACQ